MTKIPSGYYRVSVKALILDDQKRFLLSQEESGLWELPGGGMDYGEAPHACLTREIKEEMGLETTYINPQPSYFFSALSETDRWRTNTVYETKLKDLNFTPSDECVRMRFFTAAEAAKEPLYTSSQEFIKVYNPDNHEAGEIKSV